jgi:flagellar protein FlbD
LIPVHRLTHPESAVWLNPDLIQAIETTPDTVISLTNGQRFLVDESPEEILALVREWRATVVALAARTDLRTIDLKTIAPVPITGAAAR